MRLNADLLCSSLPEEYHAVIAGQRETRLSLRRPEFYLRTTSLFQTNHLYIAEEDQLPVTPNMENGAVIIVIGKERRFNSYQNYGCLIFLDRSCSLCEVFNTVQSIYNRFDRWEEKLNAVYEQNGTVQDLLDSSSSIFQNILFVLNDRLDCIALSGAQTSPFSPDLLAKENEVLSLDAIRTFLQNHDLSMSERQPMLLNLLDTTTLNANLFEGDRYIGCITVFYTSRPYRSSDDPLLNFLRGYIERLLNHYPIQAISKQGEMRTILHTIAKGSPLDGEQRILLESEANPHSYLCLWMEFGNNMSQLPVDYLCNLLESTFSNAYAFPHTTGIITVLPKTDPSRLSELLRPFYETIGLYIGISFPFQDLYQIRLYYQQAKMAVKTGTLLAPDRHFYPFTEYELPALIIQAIGDLPMQSYFGEGLEALLKHDQHSGVSYTQTLRVYLEQKCSISKTASALYINRSTLLDRLKRISRILPGELEDPDQRLRLEILLKAIELQEELQKDRIS